MFGLGARTTGGHHVARHRGCRRGRHGGKLAVPWQAPAEAAVFPELEAPGHARRGQEQINWCTSSRPRNAVQVLDLVEAGDGRVFLPVPCATEYWPRCSDPVHCPTRGSRWGRSRHRFYLRFLVVDPVSSRSSFRGSHRNGSVRGGSPTPNRRARPSCSQSGGAGTAARGSGIRVRFHRESFRKQSGSVRFFKLRMLNFLTYEI
jgi:hypothetical protein